VHKEYSPERDQRTLVKGRCHHWFEHRVWDHTLKRAPEGCTIDFFGLLAGAHGLLILSRHARTSVPYRFDPRIAGWLLL